MILYPAIILAGGLGSRLQEIVPDLPKPMAPVNDFPFLEYLLEEINKQEITHVILSVGHKHELIRNYFGNSFKQIQIRYVMEESPMGTGGAIAAAAEEIREEHFFILNGDTFFPIDFQRLQKEHFEKKADITIGLKPMEEFERYGEVEINAEQRITAFKEKSFCKKGFINGGIYMVQRSFLSDMTLTEKFSFEKEILEKQVAKKRFYGFVQDKYFIDIGVPPDYERAQTELRKFLLPFSVNEDLGAWTLFLDRDGVINRKIENDYVKQWDEFEWLPGVKEAIAVLSKRFGRIILVTNQQGVGKGLMSQEALDEIHSRLLSEMKSSGGNIDKIYAATQLKSEGSPMRKPGTGMAQLAEDEFPLLNLDRSLIAGDSESDMQFGIDSGMSPVLIAEKPIPEWTRKYHCLRYRSLADFALEFSDQINLES